MATRWPGGCTIRKNRMGHLILAIPPEIRVIQDCYTEGLSSRSEAQWSDPRYSDIESAKKAQFFGEPNRLRAKPERAPPLEKTATPIPSSCTKPAEAPPRVSSTHCKRGLWDRSRAPAGSRIVVAQI